jgi:hypothetical protein
VSSLGSTEKHPSIDHEPKIANFGLPAGLGVNSTIAYAKNSYRVELTEEEAKDIKTAWLKTYPELQEYLD